MNSTDASSERLPVWVRRFTLRRLLFALTIASVVLGAARLIGWPWGAGGALSLFATACCFIQRLPLVLVRLISVESARVLIGLSGLYLPLAILFIATGARGKEWWALPVAPGLAVLGAAFLALNAPLGGLSATAHIALPILISLSFVVGIVYFARQSWTNLAYLAGLIGFSYCILLVYAFATAGIK